MKIKYEVILNEGNDRKVTMNDIFTVMENLKYKVFSEQDYIQSISSNEYVQFFIFEYCKSFLFGSYIKKYQTEDFDVDVMVSLVDGVDFAPKRISLSEEFGKGTNRVSDGNFIVYLTYHSNKYVVTGKAYMTDGKTYYKINSLGVDKKSTQVVELIEFIIKMSLDYSPFKNSFLEIERCRLFTSDQISDIYVKIVEIENIKPESIFLPDSVREKIHWFIQAVNTYSDNHTSLRYLFSGKPGTAKTNIIKAIANECKGNATFIFTSGMETRIESVFEFASNFSPVVVCIDDLDIMIGNREQENNSNLLATFLQILDGFKERDFFLLATTNDKKMVDVAASRPGRFDFVIDINNLLPEHYKLLIEDRTNNSTLRSCFDDEILNDLKNKKVTGAFVVNLIKHLELISRFNMKQISKEYILRQISETYSGFYQDATKSNTEFGFGKTR